MFSNGVISRYIYHLQVYHDQMFKMPLNDQTLTMLSSHSNLRCFSEVRENGVKEEDEVIRDPNIFRETREREEVYILISWTRQKHVTGLV